MNEDRDERRFRVPSGQLIDLPRDEAIADAPSIYVFVDEKLALAVNVALATRRALLLEGPSGSGKSSLALAVATAMGWRYLRHVVSSRTQAREMLWDIDYVRRLHDAQAAAAHREARFDESIDRYVVPGQLWWAFDPRDAATVSAIAGPAGQPAEDRQRDLRRLAGGPLERPAVLLIDEIDKADPDVPNDLLVPLGALRFTVTPLREREVTAPAGFEPLVVITSNNERDLAPAFLRRCVRYRLGHPQREEMTRIARAQVSDVDERVVEDLAGVLLTREPASLDGDASERVSIATFVDAVRAARDLGINRDSSDWGAFLSVFREWRLGRWADDDS
jgi:MoxR-like ATPase